MLKALNSILLYVTNTDTSAEFYRKLGAEILSHDDKLCLVKIGDVTLQCFDKSKLHFTGDSDVEPKGAGVFMYIEVEDVDQTFKEVIERGLKPSSEPRDWDWGNREFAIKDPDGYKLVIYKKIG